MLKLKKNINIYITFDGLRDPLGQSQILPYLNNLNTNENIFIFSFEKVSKLNQYFKLNKNITHYSVSFQNSKFKILKIFNILNFFFLILRKIFFKKVKIIHCRGLYPAILGLMIKKIKKTKLIYDMRGFSVEEKVDNEVINLHSYFGKVLFYMLKSLERNVIENSDAIVVLTNKAKDFLQKNYKINSKISVIPCSVCYNKFNSENFKKIKKKLLRRLNVPEEARVLIYIGSFGKYYLINDILNVYYKLNETIKNLFFLIITNDNKDSKFNYMNKKFDNKIIVKTVNWRNIPKILSIADISISLIRQTFAKIASTPTKVSESLAMGIPVISNRNIGDYDEILESNKLGAIVRSSNGNLKEAEIFQIKKLLEVNKNDIRKNSKKYFCLEKAIENYKKIYDSLN